ncbi:MAG TPA: ABC transporter substrate-binding protein [Candidatus Polarisedimenticolia bacterium]|nr:ABC transporter substrate-binding protein [Candidatus Polarisedimenticolia bacterium]
MITRRALMKGLVGAGVGGALGLATRPAGAEPPPETTRIRLSQIPGICVAPQFVAEELLRAEGFTDVRYVRSPQTYEGFAAGMLDISMAFVAPFLIQVDAGVPIVMLAGVHPGCFELIGTERIRAISDLKGKTVGVLSMGSAHHVFLASMAAYVGLDPGKDINWFVHRPADSARLLGEGTVDALMGFPPVPQELRAMKVGHVVVNSAVDRPWSQYFCCMVTARSEFARQYPVATKRALRAFLKATDVCALEPERAARRLVERGFTKEYGYAIQSMKEIPYNRWREYNPEDSARFYALRLHEIGMVKASPQRLIAQGTDWRFLNELKKELKG